MTSVVWQDENTVMVVWLNRPQNISVVQLCYAMSMDCHTVSTVAAFKTY